MPCRRVQITAKVVSDADAALNAWTADFMAEFPMQLIGSNLDVRQRQAVISFIMQLGAVALLSWSLASSVTTSLTLALSWGYASAVSGLSPLAPGQWTRFAATHHTLCFSAEPLLLLLRALGTLLLLQPHQTALCALQRRLPWRESLPRLNRVFALVVAFCAGNGVAAHVCDNHLTAPGATTMPETHFCAGDGMLPG